MNLKTAYIRMRSIKHTCLDYSKQSVRYLVVRCFWIGNQWNNAYQWTINTENNSYNAIDDILMELQIC